MVLFSMELHDSDRMLSLSSHSGRFSSPNKPVLVSVGRYVIYTNLTTLQAPFYVPFSRFLKEVVLPHFEVLQQAAVLFQDS
jgi:hypothetical protein